MLFLAFAFMCLLLSKDKNNLIEHLYYKICRIIMHSLKMFCGMSIVIDHTIHFETALPQTRYPTSLSNSGLPLDHNVDRGFPYAIPVRIPQGAAP